MKPARCIAAIGLVLIFLLATMVGTAQTIRVQSHQVGEQEEILKRLFAEFTAETGIEVVHESVPHAQTLQRTLVYVAGGQAPDVIISSIQYFESLAARGVFADLAKLAQRVSGDFSFEERFFPSLLRAYSYNGVQYGVPADLDTPLLFYNVDMFKDRGVAEPNDEWTFDDLREAAIQLTWGRGPGRRYGFLVGNDAASLYFLLIPFGGEVLNEDKTESIINNEAGISTLTWMANAVHVDQFAPRPDQVAEIGPPEMMKTARVAMTLQGPWFARYHMKDVSYEWNASRIPRGPGNSTRIGGSGIGITASSNNQEAAWKFVEWFTRPERQLTLARLIGWFPTGLAATQLEGFYDPEVLALNQQQKQAVISAAAIGRAQRVIEKQGELYAIIAEELGLLWTGEKSPTEVANSIKARVDALLRNQ